jgi:hypothetical protein
MKAFAVFMPIQGVTWIFAFLTFTGSATTQYTFVVGTVFQGLILFVYHCLLDPRVNREYALAPSILSFDNRWCLVLIRYRGRSHVASSAPAVKADNYSDSKQLTTSTEFAEPASSSLSDTKALPRGALDDSKYSGSRESEAYSDVRTQLIMMLATSTIPGINK